MTVVWGRINDSRKAASEINTMDCTDFAGITDVVKVVFDKGM